MKRGRDIDASPSIRSNDRLRQERIRRNWRQQDLADRLGTTVVSVKRWERGSQHPSQYFREKLCALFEKSLEELGLMPEIPHPTDEEGSEATTPSQDSSRVWGVPFPRNLFFTGRGSVLEHLHTMLTRQSTCAALTQSSAVYGLGGIGKTQLAIEYAYQYRADYDAVLWVEAETQTAMVSSFATLAALLALPEQTEEDQHKIVAAVLRWLNGHQGWLLIFDNVEDLSLLKPFLPASQQGALLLTTRLQSLGTLAQRVELPPLTMQEGCDFLLARTSHLRQSEEHVSIDPQEMAVAQQIVAEMGGLPLALEQAGAYIDATQCSLSEYLHLFQTVPHRLLDAHEPSSDHPLSVSRTFALAFEQVEQRNPLAAELLTVCAFLASDAIPETFFLEGAPWLGPLLEPLAKDALAFSEAIKALFSYSLIQRHASARTLTVHRLIQAVLKGRLSEDAQRVWIRRVLETIYQLFPADEWVQANYWLVCEQLLPHAQGCLLLADLWDEDKTWRIPLMCRVATYLFERTRSTEAGQLFERAAQMGEHTPGLPPSIVAEALVGLAELYRVQGKHEQAESLFLRVVCSQEQAMGAGDHLWIAKTLERLGNLYKRQGKYEQAEPLLERALCLWEQAFDPDHPLTAYFLKGLGAVYFEQGKYEQAEPLLERALRLVEQAFDPDHPLVAYSLTALGSVYFEQGRYEQAEPLLERALCLVEQVLGSQHLNVAPSLNNLGELYQKQGRYEQAELLLERALHLWEQGLGPEHPNVAYPLNNLGELYHEQGRYEQAEPLFQRALHLWEQGLGPEHPNVAYPLHGLANLYREQGKYEQAKSLYQRALKLRQKRLEDLHHPEVADILYDLARCHQQQRQTTEALSLYQHALTIREQTLGPDHPKTRKTRTDYARLQEEEAVERASHSFLL